ncbi:MAG TPA: TonB-dependent receptor plug domain-containing protein, partial [Gemmatimonadales bacterium]
MSGKRAPAAALRKAMLCRAVVATALLWAGYAFDITSILPLIAHRSPLTLLAQFPQDTIPDSLKVDEDTIYTTEDYLKQQQQVNVRRPVLPLLGVEGPRPALTRIVFDRDSIEWGHAATVGDLLTQVPGVFLWRGGYIGRPEPVNYQGRGAASAEYFLDGIPYVAAGVDSLGVDPAQFSISFLERIEVERWPGRLKVHLFTRRHDRLAPRSRIAIARGDNNYARYEASLERRFGNGPGYALGADYLNSPTASGRSSTYSNTQVWAQGSYIPSRFFGAQYQLL